MEEPSFPRTLQQYKEFLETFISLYKPRGVINHFENRGREILRNKTVVTI